MFFGNRVKDAPEPVIIREVDVQSRHYKDDPWDIPWENDVIHGSDGSDQEAE